MRILFLGILAGITVFSVAHAYADDDPYRIRFDVLGSADRDIRDIDLRVLSVSKTLFQNEPFAFGLQVGAMSAGGRSIEPNALFYSDADANGFFAGGSLRMSPSEHLTVKPFVEGGVSLLLMDRPFPNDPSLSGFQGRAYGKFDVRWGLAFSFDAALNFETTFVFTHISNGSGFGPQNINYDGIGFSVGLSHRW